MISCISKYNHCFLSNHPEVVALSYKFSETWIITLRMLDEPQIRQICSMVCLRACMHYKWETVLVSKARHLQICPCSVLLA